MITRRNTLIVSIAALAAISAACGKVGEEVGTARDRIFNALKGQGIYERGNLPEPEPNPDQIKGWFTIVDGAYRWIENEDRLNRAGSEWEIRRGDSLALMFDARIFTGGNFENQQTFYTNIPSRIKELASNNPDFSGWEEGPMKIKVGDDDSILKSLQEALISCMAGDGDLNNDDQPDGVASDRVRVYLTPDLVFGNKTVYNVPRNSTLVIEVSDMEIIKN